MITWHRVMKVGTAMYYCLDGYIQVRSHLMKLVRRRSLYWGFHNFYVSLTIVKRFWEAFY